MRNIIIFIIVLFMSSCAAYHSMKIDQEAVDAALKSPNLQIIAVDAQTIEHPILKPITIDLKNGLSPDEVAVLAVLTNPGLKGVRDEKGIAEAELIQAGILPNPQLAASYDIPSGGSTAGTTSAYGLQLGWDITSLIGRKDRISAAQSAKTAVDLSVAWQEWQTAESAKLHLLHILWKDIELKLLKHKKSGYEKDVDVLKKAVDQGEKTVVELVAAESAARQIEMDISNVTHEREQERLMLNQVLGIGPETMIKIESRVEFSNWPPLSGNTDFMSGIESRRPDLLALKMGYDSQEARLRQAVLSQFPDIGIDLNQARDTSNVVTTGPGLSIDFPLFDRGQGRIALEKATRKKLYDEYMARIFNTRADIAAVIEQIESGRMRINIAGKSVDALELLVNTYKKAVKQGNADILSFYQAQQDLIAKRLELVNLKQSVTDLGIALEIAAGMYFPMDDEKGDK